MNKIKMIFQLLMMLTPFMCISCKKSSTLGLKTAVGIERFTLRCGETSYRGAIDEDTKVILVEGITQSGDITGVDCRLAKGATLSPDPAKVVKWEKSQTFTLTVDGKQVQYTVQFPDFMPETTSKVVIGYMPLADWQFEDLYPEIKWNYLTYVNVCFASVKSDGTLNTDKVNTPRLATVRDDAHAHGVKILISFNKNSEGEFAEAIAGDDSRAALIKNIIGFTKENQLDGFDIDFEDYKHWNTVNLVKFAKELNEAKEGSMLMTCAVVDWLDYGTEFWQYFDYINIMSYDKHNAAGPTPVQHASYDDFVNDLTKWATTFNAPKSKIIGGLPFYGYSWDPDHAGDDNRQIRYSSIVNTFPEAADTDITSNGLIYYNGKPTILEKCKYIMDEGYGGVMIWQLFQDSFDQDKSLMEVIGQTMSPQLQR